jgi:predicted Zn-dependent protease
MAVDNPPLNKLTDKKNISYINDTLISLWTKSAKTKAKALALKTFADNSINKDRFFYLKNGQYFRKNKDHKNAYKFFKKSSSLYEDDELSSICSYIELVKLHKYKLAIKELDRYLQKNKAKSYKTTLIELLEELQNGYATDYEDLIIKYSLQNKINIKKYYPSWTKK